MGEASLAVGTISAYAALAIGCKPLLEKGASLLGVLFEKPFEVAGSMLSDQIYFWRTQRAITMAGKAAAMLEDAGIEPKSLPPGFLIPLLDLASVSESEEIHDLFAKLLVSAVSNDVYQHPIFRHAASQINVDELKLLIWLGGGSKLKFYGVGIRPEPLFRQMIIDSPAAPIQVTHATEFYADNLQRLGLLNNMQADQEVAVPPMHLLSDKRVMGVLAEASDPSKIFYQSGHVGLTPAGELLAKVAMIAESKSWAK